MSMEKNKWEKELEKPTEAGKSRKALTMINKALDRMAVDIQQKENRALSTVWGVNIYNAGACQSISLRLLC